MQSVPLHFEGSVIDVPAKCFSRAWLPNPTLEKRCQGLALRASSPPASHRRNPKMLSDRVEWVPAFGAARCLSVLMATSSWIYSCPTRMVRGCSFRTGIRTNVCVCFHRHKHQFLLVFSATASFSSLLPSI